VVFTDGVVEAEDINGDEYGEERLLFMLHSGAQLAPGQMLQKLTADLDHFVAGAPQHDDITCMLVKAS
jgi:phosphoserine phosphatase RsbU/P